jgi:LysM repeat protein
MRRKGLVGQRFGRLVVLAAAEGVARWLVQCDCGNTKAVRADHLLNGKTKTCGCWKQELDLTGQRLGKLLVIARAGVLGHGSGWLVRCDCGTEKVVSRRTISCGKVKACGCSRYERRSVRARQSTTERLWSKITKAQDANSCWPWTGPVGTRGYGLLTVASKTKQAHRLVWEEQHGAISDGMVICHKCDNPNCCNPNHLFIGTQKDNLADCRAKGRFPAGPRHGLALHPERRARGSKVSTAKLTERDIPEIYHAKVAGDSIYAIAERYGVSASTIHLVCKGKTWRHANLSTGGGAC